MDLGGILWTWARKCPNARRIKAFAEKNMQEGNGTLFVE
jgi:hypothetical protein